MQTNNIKSFARKARILLMEGVTQRLKYWGFNENGSNSYKLEPTTGGYVFRGKVFTDVSVPGKWNKLKIRVKDRQSVQDIIEEAAYTWFNRLMALRVMEINGYMPYQIGYASETRTPMIVQNSKRGNHKLKKQQDIDLLGEYIRDSKDEDALGLLLVCLCNNNKLLHDVFGRIDDYTEILLPQNLLQKDGIIDLINSSLITEEDYKQVELIGWLYQFYIADKKAQVFAGFKKNQKARAEDIPAATSIFTPKWIVKYMVENTVGKIYLDYESDSEIRSEMKYLVENEDDNDGQPIINDITRLTLMDPACGSGHILVTGFDLLFRMYREAGYTARQATESILKYNLFGLEIGDRAMQLARFALLLKAAEYDDSILKSGIMPQISSFPEPSNFHSEEIQHFLGIDGYDHIAELKDALHELNQGKNIGSALKLDLSDKGRELIQNKFNQWIEKQQTASLDLESQSIWNRLKPFLEVLLLMTRKYASVVANPPYMGQKNMNGELKNYVNKHYPFTKSDLFAVFIEAMVGMVEPKARMGCITMESWMFLSSYEKLRNKLLDNYSIVSLAHFGWHIIGIAFGTAALILEKSKRIKQGEYSYLTIDDIDRNTNTPFVFPKMDNGRYARITQDNFSKIPGSPIAYWVSEKEKGIYENGDYLENYAYPRKGIDTGENDYFLRLWYEIDVKEASLIDINFAKRWFPYNKGGEYRKWYGNREYIINWKDDGKEIKSRLSWNVKKPTIRNSKFHFQEGFSWTTVSSSGFSCRYVPAGCLFDNGGCTLFSDKNLKYFGSLLNSKIAQRYLEFLSPTLNYQPGDIGRILYIKPNSKLTSVIRIVDSPITISKKDWDSRETSWDFGKSPLLNERNSLKQAYHKWKEDATSDFFQLHEYEEELNRIFIDLYGLQDELTPDVPFKDITILQEELDRKALEQIEPVFREGGKDAVKLPIQKEEVLSQFVSYCIGIMMGRYRLDKPGLNIAHPDPTDQELASYTHNGQTIMIYNDAIMPLMGNNCNFPDDALIRIKEILLAIWGEESLTGNLNFLQESLGMDLHTWLTEKFWGYHAAMYKKKPIYWLFSSNLEKPAKAAFKVLTYMHRMDKFTVQKIQRQYLFPHQEYIKREIKKLKDNEDNLSKTELKRLEMLRSWEVECLKYNEVLKELANKQIGFDLDDGVNMNYPKFDGAVAKI
jgi:hypothetical protein